MSKKMKKSKKHLARQPKTPDAIEKITIRRNPVTSPKILVEAGSEKYECSFVRTTSSNMLADKAGQAVLPSLSDVPEIEVMGLFHLLTMEERYSLITWAYGVLRKGGILRIASPHWSHGLAYADPTAEWPPLTMEFFLCSNAEFRKNNAPYLDCLPVDFDIGWAGSYDNNDAWIAMRSDDVKAERMQHNTNATREIIATLTKR